MDLAAVPLWMSVVGQVLIVAGSLVFASATVGLVRLPDAYTRSSSNGTAAGIGVGLILTGAFFFVPGLATAVKLVVAVLLQLITSPVGGMAIARSAYLAGGAVSTPARHADLAGALAERAEPAELAEAGEPGEAGEPAEPEELSDESSSPTE